MPRGSHGACDHGGRGTGATRPGAAEGEAEHQGQGVGRGPGATSRLAAARGAGTTWAAAPGIGAASLGKPHATLAAIISSASRASLGLPGPATVAALLSCSERLPGPPQPQLGDFQGTVPSSTLVGSCRRLATPGRVRSAARGASHDANPCAQHAAAAYAAIAGQPAAGASEARGLRSQGADAVTEPGPGPTAAHALSTALRAAVAPSLAASTAGPFLLPTAPDARAPRACGLHQGNRPRGVSTTDAACPAVLIADRSRHPGRRPAGHRPAGVRLQGLQQGTIQQMPPCRCFPLGARFASWAVSTSPKAQGVAGPGPTQPGPPAAALEFGASCTLRGIP